jgi:hypothetical protein
VAVAIVKMQRGSHYLLEKVYLKTIPNLYLLGIKPPHIYMHIVTKRSLRIMRIMISLT